MMSGSTWSDFAFVKIRVPSAMNIRDRNGSNGQKGSHNSSVDDHVSTVSNSVMLFCQ